VPTPDGVLWDREPHTEAKHRLYRLYLQAWFPILLRTFPRGVTYAEGFAGPGEYTGGDPGSPLIALRTALLAQPGPNKDRPAYFIMVEKNRRRLEHLRHVLTRELGDLRSEALLRRGLVIDLRSGDCEDILPDLLARHRAHTRPLLVVLDTFGSAVSFSLLRHVAASQGAEVIVTIQPQHFARFASDPNHFGDRVFGPTVWRDVQTRPSHEKADYIRTRYRRTVQEAGFRYVLDFELADEKNNLLYLVYGTNHRTGVVKMKDAMWSVDPISGIGYRDPRDPRQQMLPFDLAADTAPLRRLLLEHLTGLPTYRATVGELHEFTLLGTIYKATHTTAAVASLMADKKLRNVTGGRLTAASTVEPTGIEPLF